MRKIVKPHFPEGETRYRPFAYPGCLSRRRRCASHRCGIRPEMQWRNGRWNLKEGIMSLRGSRTETPERNCLQEAATRFQRRRNGPKVRRTGWDTVPSTLTWKAYGFYDLSTDDLARNTIKDAARLGMAKWYNKVEEAESHSFNVIAGYLLWTLWWYPQLLQQQVIQCHGWVFQC